MHNNLDFIVFVQAMETNSRNFKQNFFDRAKSFFQHLRWIFCLSTPDESRDASGNHGKSDPFQMPFITNHQQHKDFADLPAECKLKIFSFLTPQEKGLNRLVCLEWRDLLKTSVLWQDVDFTSIKLHCKCCWESCKSMTCYEEYKKKMIKFVDYIVSIQPIVRRLKFSFDMIDCDDGWSDMLQSFLESVHMREVQVAEINWLNTPEKPESTWNSGELSENMNDLLFKQRRRHRRFEAFFDSFTRLSCRLRCLTITFEWTERSLYSLCRLTHLEVLILHQCSDSHTKLEQNLLSHLLQALPNLKHLVIEATFSNCFVFGQLFPCSKSLQKLNLANCTGVVFTGFNLPILDEIHIGKKLRRQNSLDQNPAMMACLHDLLVSGAPDLKIFNGRCLPSDWKTNITDEVSNILIDTCSCPTHGTNQ